MKIVNKALKITIRDLRSCYFRFGIIAGRKHFNDYWARDGFYSTFACCKLRDFNIVKKNLELFIKYQRENGQLPLRVGDYNIFLKFYGIDIVDRIRPRYIHDKYLGFSMDQNPLFIIASLEYIKKSRDYDFTVKHYNNFVKAINWSFENDKDDNLLVEEGHYSTWADSLKKIGEILYTNILHCKSLKDMSEISRIVRDKENERKYFNLYKKILKKINHVFWNKKYFIDFYYNKVKYDYLSTDGNLLAILFNLTTKQQTKKIINSIEKYRGNDFLFTNYPKYKWNLIFPLFWFSNMQDYHNGMLWLWESCLWTLILYKNGFKKSGLELLKKISELIIKYKSIYEVYDNRKGYYQPVKRFFYKSEKPLAWNAAMFIYAVREMAL